MNSDQFWATLRAMAVLVVVAAFSGFGQTRPCIAQDKDELSKDSLRQEGVPAGEIKGPFQHSSLIFPGTQRRYWIYVPSQYRPESEACLLVVQDGLNRAQGWKLPVVMDNLIHQAEMPVTIGVFIEPGVIPADDENSEARFNRSFEYDSVSDRYARFLHEELLPKVEAEYSISKDPNNRAIAGASSGAICAFVVAWHRPDSFRRVISTIGTYVGLRGGNEFPTLIRKMEPKPIRIFLQDGSNDLDIYAGDWWIANQDMLSAFRFSGYQVRHAWGEGGHNGRQAAAIMPEILRWLWKGHPAPVENVEGVKRRADLLVEGEGWEMISESHEFVDGPAVNAEGEVFYTDAPTNKVFKIDLNGKVTEFVDDSKGASGAMFGADGKLYVTLSRANQIGRYSMAGELETIQDAAFANDLVVLPNGGYYTDPRNQRVCYVNEAGEVSIVDEGVSFPNGIIVSPDQTRLYVGDTNGRFVYVYRIDPETGQLKFKQPYGYLHLAAGGLKSEAEGMTVDTNGFLYVATELGIQILDQLGRVNLILDRPGPGRLTNVVFGGKDRNFLYATCGEKIYRRKLNATGSVPWEKPIKPPRPGL